MPGAVAALDPDTIVHGGVPSSNWCDVLVVLGPLKVHGPVVILLCLAALVIGVVGFLRIQASKFPGNPSQVR